MTATPFAATGVLKNERSISDSVELTRFFCSGESVSRSDLRREALDVGAGEIEASERSYACSGGSTDSVMVLAKNGEAPFE